MSEFNSVLTGIHRTGRILPVTFRVCGWQEEWNNTYPSLPLLNIPVSISFAGIAVKDEIPGCRNDSLDAEQTQEKQKTAEYIINQVVHQLPPSTTLISSSNINVNPSLISFFF